MTDSKRHDSPPSSLVARRDDTQSHVVADRAVDRLRAAFALDRLLGHAPAFVRVLGQLAAVARGDATALVTGETGTGKELVARAIHYLGRRAGGPFVPVNCGSLPETLLEDELFGHEQGAFTDARRRRVGLLAQSHGGTLFLDEIDSLTPRAQVSLLRVLQDGTYRPLGGVGQTQADIRFIAASNSDLSARVHAGGFRPDLYYRLCVLTLHLPPLRERREDVLELAHHFLEKHAGGEQTPPRLAPDAEVALIAHDWPGNVRELENAMIRALCHHEHGVVHAGDLALPSPRRPGSASGSESDTLSPANASGASRGADAPGEEPLRAFSEMKRDVVVAFERHYLMRLMAEHGGNVSRAARSAGKERRELGKLLKKHRVDPRYFAPPRSEERAVVAHGIAPGYVGAKAPATQLGP